MTPTTKRKVLLIDDEKFLLEIYSIKFLKSGFDVFACGSADEGFQAIRNGYVPDVILFDITMPDKSGYQFLEGLGALNLPESCIKIALTNQGHDGEIRRTAELGVDAHLVKARYTAAEVVEKVLSLISARA